MTVAAWLLRTKLIYALADAALVVKADYGKGGTWAGAIEQLDNLRLVPVYILPNAQPDAALETLAKKGALTWPTSTTPEDFREALAAEIGPEKCVRFRTALLFVRQWKTT